MSPGTPGRRRRWTLVASSGRCNGRGGADTNRARKERPMARATGAAIGAAYRALLERIDALSRHDGTASVASGSPVSRRMQYRTCC